jgi:outer membrane murein-binding lipoprotein Lpp
MWTLVIQFIWKILKDPKLLAIVALSVLLAGASVKGYWYKQKVDKLEQKVSELNMEISNLKEINKKITQNRDALVRQVEDLMEIDKKYKSLQVRIDALRKTCAQPAKPIIVTSGSPPAHSLPPGSPPPIGGMGEPKPTEKAPGSVVLPEGAIMTLPQVSKPEGSQPIGKEGDKTEIPEYLFGGYEYEKDAKAIYNDIISWFNSNKLLPKGAGPMSNSKVSIPK